MKILHLIAPGPIAGAEKSVLASVRALQDADCDVSLAAIKEARKPELGESFSRLAEENGIECAEFEARGRLDTRLMNRLRRVIGAGGYTVIHAHGFKALAYVSAVRREGTALIATYHGATAHNTVARIYEWIEWALYQQLDCLFVVSDGAREALNRRGKLRCQAAIVPNILFDALPEPTETEEKGATDPLELLYLGRLSIEKGADVLIDALSHMPASCGTRLTVLGDGPLRPELERATQKKGLGDRVVFKGFQPNIADYLSRCDALVMPSRTEGLPMALIEAAVIGKPVIASRVGGIPDIVQPERNGLLVPPDRPDKLARAIEQLADARYRFALESVRLAPMFKDRYSAARWATTALERYKAAIDFLNSR